MIRRHFGSLALALALPLAFTAPAQAQSYPSKPIRMVVPFPPGGGTDILARLVAQKLTEANHWTVVPDNRGGAGGTIGIAEAARAAPTGYDIVMGQKDNMVVAPWLYKNLSYHPVKDLTAVAHVAYTPVVIVTQANSKFKTLDDVVKAARAAPDTVTYGSPGNGTTIHLAGEIFNGAAQIKMRHVPYKGSNAAMMDVLAGNVDLMVSSVPSALAQIKAGKLRALAVAPKSRFAGLPDVPTVAEQGYPGFDVHGWYGLLLKAGTPAPVVQRLYAEVKRSLDTQEVREIFQAQGIEPGGMPPAEFTALIRDDLALWKRTVEQLNITLQ